MPGERLPLVLLPGMMCDERLWWPQSESLAPLCNEVIHPQISGFDSIGALAEDVLRKAPNRFSLAGLSMGGIVAFEMMRQAPERIARLALLDTNARAEAPDRQAARQPQMNAVAAGKLNEVMREELKPRYLAELNRSRPGLLDLVLGMAMALGPEVFQRQSIALRDRPDSLEGLKQIQCPTLVLCGEEDELCPVRYHLDMFEAIPGAELVIVPDCGHLSTLEQPVAVTQAMSRWLGRPATNSGER